jgi:hypothetical protein
MKQMDRLHVSYWLRGFTTATMLQHFATALRKFPFSKLATAASVLRVYGVSYNEPALLEAPLSMPPDVEAIVATSRDFLHEDVCVQVETFWDLWWWDSDWKLHPVRLQIACFGPAFEDAEDGENLRIDFGLEDQFLPSHHDGGLAMIRANIQSLLRLVHDLDEALPGERRQLWSESGENFAEKLQATLRNA